MYRYLVDQLEFFKNSKIIFPLTIQQLKSKYTIIKFLMSYYRRKPVKMAAIYNFHKINGCLKRSSLLGLFGKLTKLLKKEIKMRKHHSTHWFCDRHIETVKRKERKKAKAVIKVKKWGELGGWGVGSTMDSFI